MTKEEEAAEEILKGAFENCPACQAPGEGCIGCYGTHKMYRLPYLYACDLLGVPPTPLMLEVTTALRTVNFDVKLTI